MTPRRPVLRWHGGKWMLAPWIIAQFPPHPLYDDRLKGWRRMTREALADGARKRTEVLWINSTASDGLFREAHA